MEPVSIKNSPAVCENSLASEVNQMSGTSVSITNFTKPSCKIKNGLINGVTEEKCNSNNIHSKIMLGTNQCTKKTLSDISNDKHNQHLAQNCVDNSDIFPQSNETLSVCDSCDMSSEKNQHCTESTNGKCKAKHKKKAKSNSGDKCTEVTYMSDTDTNLDSGNVTCNTELSSELKKSTSAESCSKSDALESNELEVVMHHKLKLEDPIDVCVKAVESGASCDVDVSQNVQDHCEIAYVQYESELQMPLIMKIIQKDLSEPYSIYTYRYFIHNWPKLCFLAMCDDKCVGAIVCKLDYHRKSTKRGYIAMLAVDQHYRKQKIGSTLVRRAIREMIAGNADEVVLETEVTNKPALRLYELLGFVRDKRLFRYYLNGVDALRLKLWLR